jgi:hypothetical protein
VALDFDGVEDGRKAVPLSGIFVKANRIGNVVRKCGILGPEREMFQCRVSLEELGGELLANTHASRMKNQAQAIRSKSKR